MKVQNNIKRLVSILILLIAFKSAFAQQEPMYTQYLFNTQVINPAYTGTWESLGFIVLGRHQWVEMPGAPRTYTFAMQTPVGKKEKVALGLSVISDVIFKEKRFGLFGDYSYKLRINEKGTWLRLGLKAGFTNYSHNFNDYNLISPNDNQFQGEASQKFMPNLGVGAFLYNRQKYYFGLSIPKIIQNDFDLNINNYSVQSELRHFYMIGGLVIDLSEDVKFKPTGLIKLSLGSPVQFDVTANFLLKEKLWLGAMLRTKLKTGGSYGFISQWIFNNNLRIGYAIDFATGNIGNYAGLTHEVMVSYTITTLKETFISPRYF